MNIVDSIPLSLGETIGSLMTSIIDAQAQAARATVEFIEDVGTVEVSSDLDSVHELRSVSFKYKKFDENFENKEFVVDIPLLSMVDIPLVSIKNAKFSFNYQITQTTKENQSASPAKSASSASGSKKVVLGKMMKPLPITKSASIIGKFKKQPAKSASSSNTSTSAQETGGLDVTIELEKVPLPIGIDRILEILELAASENKVDEKNEAQ